MFARTTLLTRRIRNILPLNLFRSPKSALETKRAGLCSVQLQAFVVGLLPSTKGAWPKNVQSELRGADKIFLRCLARFISGWLQRVEHTAREDIQNTHHWSRVLDDLEYRTRNEWAKLDHAVIASDVRQWRRHLSACVRTGGGHFEHCF